MASGTLVMNGLEQRQSSEGECTCDVSTIGHLLVRASCCMAAHRPVSSSNMMSTCMVRQRTSMLISSMKATRASRVRDEEVTERAESTPSLSFYPPRQIKLS